MIGKTISHYKIIEKIGEGGMGEVYLAEDTDLDRKVALKFLPEDLTSDPDIKARFKREAKAAAALNHPNIITIHEVGEFEGKTYIVMEYVEGESLKDQLSKQEISFNKSIAIAIEICEGLSEAHQAGIVHRDIKPDNILLDLKERVKIADFGLAKVKGVSRLTKQESTLGTAHYMSPEQARGEDVDPRSDIFSFGAVLYEMITGRLPFEGDYEAAVTYSILHEDPEPIARYKANVPDGLQSILDKTLAKTPDERYQHADEIIVDLKSLKNELKSVKNELKSGKKVARSTIAKAGHRKRIYVYRGLAILLILLLLIVGRTYFFTEPDEGINSIAVMPLKNLTGDAEQDYFVEGMTEELISKLCRIQNLQVASMKGMQKDVKEVGEEFGVRYVLDGSVRKSGDHVRITAMLIDATTGFHLWSDDFDGELSNLFALQEETALKIAEALNLQLSPEEAEALGRRYTENVQAYDAYLRGWALVESFHVSLAVPKERLEAARKHFEEALASDPNYPLALAGLSILHSYYHWFNVDRTPERLRRAEESAQKALALDPQLPEAHVALGEVFAHQGDFASAIDEFRQGLRRDPDNPKNAFAWCHLAWACNSQDPPDPVEAEKAAREAIRLQPGYFWSYSVLGEALELQARYEEAIAAYEYALQLNPDLQSWGGLGRLYYNQGKYEEALSTYDKIVNAGSKDMYDWLFYFVYSSRAGKFDEAQARLREFSKSLKDESWIAPVVLFYSGEISENMVWKSAEHEDLQKAREQKCEAYYYLGMAYLLNKELRLKSAAPDTAKAQEYFEQCLDTNITDFIEYEEAKKELERLENISQLTTRLN